MTKRFRELAEEEKLDYSVTHDAQDESFVYCPNCGRAMKQGDCIIDEELDVKLRCAYDDCMLAGNIAAQRLFAWDAYRDEYEEETADWPDTPTPGECYRPSHNTP